MYTESEVEQEYLLFMGDEANNATFLDDSIITEEFSLWPRFCHNTDRLIWFKTGIRARRFYHNFQNKLNAEDRWFDRNEFLMLKLKDSYAS